MELRCVCEKEAGCIVDVVRGTVMTSQGALPREFCDVRDDRAVHPALPRPRRVLLSWLWGWLSLVWLSLPGCLLHEITMPSFTVAILTFKVDLFCYNTLTNYKYAIQNTTASLFLNTVRERLQIMYLYYFFV